MELAALILAGLSAIAAGAALYQALTSSPARLSREFGELEQQVAMLGRAVTTLRDDGTLTREEFTKHRVAVQSLVDEALEALERAEVKRRRAAKERGRAQEIVEGEALAATPCRCGRSHPGDMSCLTAAELEWTQRGVM